MRKRLIGGVLAAVLVVVLVPAVAQAEKPLADVDCDQLEQTVVAFFAEAPLEFKNLGHLISTFQNDEALFAEAAAGFAFVSSFFGDPILFESMSQTASTHAKCGLTPLVRSLVGG